MEALIAILNGIVGKDNVMLNEPMSKHTTFEIGGPAEVMVTPETADEVAEVVKACNEAGVAWRVLGNGSDLLVSDEGVGGVVIQLLDKFNRLHVHGNVIAAMAGATNAQVAEAAQAAGLAGYEFACGIPGTIGGAAIMNAGAYDGQFADAATEVLCCTPEGEFALVFREEADWTYRHSMMSDEGYIVLGVIFELTEDDPDAIQARMDDLQERRSSKQPLEMPSAGSTFKRPEGYFAGKLIQDAGLRGYSVGGAQVSTKHTGFVVNTGGATAADVRQLISDVQAAVEKEFGVKLEPEVRFWE
jgi:UDP-N-acetylmuramate dehydrogenase